MTTIHQEKLFSKLEYKGSEYKESNQYIESQPAADRKKGFGSGDAFRTDEFMSVIRTSQYRETLEKEFHQNQSRRDTERESSILQELSETEKARGFPEHLSENRHLYDIGRSDTTPFDPKSSKDRFYNTTVPRTLRFGSDSVTSRNIGDAAWDIKYHHPEHGCISYTKTFNDKSHLQTEP